MLTRIRAHLPLWRRALRRRRRMLSLLLLAVIATLLLPSLLPPSARGAPVVVAAADLPAGTELAPEHLRTVRVAAELAPSLASPDPGELLGVRTVLPLPAGTPVVLGLIEEGAPAVPHGASLMALPAPAELAAHLLPGTEIEIHSPAGESPELGFPPREPGTARRITARVVELAEPSGTSVTEVGAGAGEVVVLVTVDRDAAGRLAGAIGGGWFTVAVIG